MSPSPRVWRKYSKCSSSECVEVCIEGDVVHTRWSEEPNEVTTYSGAEWDAFVAGVKAGEFDRPTSTTIVNAS